MGLILFHSFGHIARYTNRWLFHPVGRLRSRKTSTLPTATDPVLNTRALIFKALGHPTRLAIVDLLADAERCVCDINDHFPADLSTVSRHLADLREVGLLARDKRGNQVLYRLECPCITTFYGCLEKVIGNPAKPGPFPVRGKDDPEPDYQGIRRIPWPKIAQPSAWWRQSSSSWPRWLSMPCGRPRMPIPHRKQAPRKNSWPPSPVCWIWGRTNAFRAR